MERFNDISPRVTLTRPILWTVFLMTVLSRRVRIPGPTLTSQHRYIDIIIYLGGIIVASCGLLWPRHSIVIVGCGVLASTIWSAARIWRLTVAPSVGRQPHVWKLAMGMLATGVLCQMGSVVGSAIATLTAPDILIGNVVLPVEIPNVGLFFAVISYVVGLVVLPGAPSSVLGRIRRILDGFTIGILVFFIVWVLVFSTRGLLGAALTSALLASVAIGMSAVAGIRISGTHATQLALGLGIIISIIGHSSLTIVMDYEGTNTVIVGSGVLLVVGPMVTVVGATGLAHSAGHQGFVSSDGNFAGYPLMALPFAGAALAAGYHFIQARSFDTTAMMLFIVGAVIVALRETLTAIDMKRYSHHLASQKAQFRSLFSESTDMILVLDENLIVQWQSSVAARLFGLSDHDVIGTSLPSLLHPSDGEYVAQHVLHATSGDIVAGAPATIITKARIRDGFARWRDVELRLIDHRADPAIQAFAAHICDLSDHKGLGCRLQQMVDVDQITALPNRRALLNAIMTRPTPGTLITIHIDGIDRVRTAHDPVWGNTILAEAARRLCAGVSSKDLPARLDEDTFAVVTGSGAIQAQFLATRLVTVLEEPYSIPSDSTYVCATAGLTEFIHDPSDSPVWAEEVIRRAEWALRRARRGLGEAVEWHENSLGVDIPRQLALGQELPEAITCDELEIRFQPIMDLGRSRTVGVEAVVSWRHPMWGVVMMDEILRTAEDVGVGPQIHTWIIHRCCRQLSSWIREGHDIWISTNVSIAQLTNTDYIDMIILAAETYQVPAGNLMIEISETEINQISTTMHHDHRRVEASPVAGASSSLMSPRVESIILVLRKLRSAGIRVAIDHFGTATTSLSRLRLLPADLLKIDRRPFLDSLNDQGPTSMLIDVIVRFGHQLGVELAAQGLDDKDDVQMVTAAGFHYGQGSSFSDPVLPEYVEAYLENHHTHRF